MLQVTHFIPSFNSRLTFPKTVICYVLECWLTIPGIDTFWVVSELTRYEISKVKLCLGQFRTLCWFLPPRWLRERFQVFEYYYSEICLFAGEKHSKIYIKIKSKIENNLAKLKMKIKKNWGHFTSDFTLKIQFLSLWLTETSLMIKWNYVWEKFQYSSGILSTSTVNKVFVRKLKKQKQS